MTLITPKQKETIEKAGVDMATVLAGFAPSNKFTHEAEKNLVTCGIEMSAARTAAYEAGSDKTDAEKDGLMKDFVAKEKKYFEAVTAQADARAKDEKATEESMDAMIEAAIAQGKKQDLGTVVWGPDEREMVTLSSAVNSIDLLNCWASGRQDEFPGQYHEVIAETKKRWDYNSLHNAANSGVVSMRGSLDILPEWLLNSSERKAVIEEAKRHDFVKAATTTHANSFGADGATSDEAGNVRAKANLRRLFNGSIAMTVGADVRSVGSGQTNFIVTETGVTPKGRAEAATDPAEAMTFWNHTQKLRRISGTIETTEETELFVPGTQADTRADMRAALQEEFDRLLITGEDVGFHEGLLYAAAAAARTGSNPPAIRNAGRIVPSGAALDLTGTSPYNDMLAVASTKLSGSDTGRIVDYKTARGLSDLRILSAADVQSKFDFTYDMYDKKSAARVLRDEGAIMQGTQLIADANTPAAGYYPDKQTYMFFRREDNPRAVGDVSIFPMLKLKVDEQTKQDSAIIRYTICMFASIYMAVRPTAWAKVPVTMLT